MIERIRDLAAVVVGGLLGTSLRLGGDAVLPHTDATFPWSTLVINIVGAFLLGFLVARVWPSAPSWLRAGLGTGVMGSFTTFSALIASVVTLSRSGAVGAALLYLVVSLVAGLAAAAVGLRVGRPRATGRAAPALAEDE